MFLFRVVKGYVIAGLELGIDNQGICLKSQPPKAPKVINVYFFNFLIIKKTVLAKKYGDQTFVQMTLEHTNNIIHDTF